MLADGTAAELYRRGRWRDFITAPPRLAWVRRHQPGIWAEIRRFSMIADWMVLRLTGTLASEASIGSTSGLFDLGRAPWSPELLAQCGFDPAWFPEVVEAGTVVRAGVRPGRRPDGLAAGNLRSWRGGWTPRSAWPARSRAQGRAMPPGLHRSPASFWKQTVLATAPVVEPARPAAHDLPRPARANGWSRALGSTPGSRCAGSGTRPPRTAGCRATPSSRNGPRRFRPAPVDLPHGWSRPTPGPGHAGSRRSRRGPRRPGTRPGPGAGRAGPGHPGSRRLPTRRTAGAGSRLAGARRCAEVLLSGGAARSRLWPQILADVLGCRVSVAGQTETAALGAAILAGRAAGVLPDGTPPAAGPRPDGCAAAGRPRSRPCSPARPGSGPTTTSTPNGFLRVISGHSRNLHGMTALAPTPEVARPAARAGGCRRGGPRRGGGRKEGRGGGGGGRGDRRGGVGGGGGGGGRGGRGEGEGERGGGVGEGRGGEGGGGGGGGWGGRGGRERGRRGGGRGGGGGGRGGGRWVGVGEGGETGGFGGEGWGAVRVRGGEGDRCRGAVQGELDVQDM